VTEELADIVVDRREHAVVVRIRGEIDLSNSGAMRDELTAIARSGRGLALDLSALSYLDSAGIAMLDGLHRYLHEDGRALRIVAAPDAPVRRVLTLSAMSDIIPVDDSEDDALKELGAVDL
jgi:anti-sigma B factor antagonist